MTLSQASEIALQKFVTDWGVTTPFTLDNEGSGLAEGSVAWVRAVVRERVSRQLSLGITTNRRFNRKAALVCQVFTPINTGSLASNVLVDSLREFFEGVTVSGLMFHNVEARNEGNDGKWYQVNVMAHFEFDEVK